MQALDTRLDLWAYCRAYYGAFRRGLWGLVVSLALGEIFAWIGAVLSSGKDLDAALLWTAVAIAAAYALLAVPFFMWRKQRRTIVRLYDRSRKRQSKRLVAIAEELIELHFNAKEHHGLMFRGFLGGHPR
jgi:hypothetical protein